MRSRSAFSAAILALSLLFSLFLTACGHTPEGDLPDFQTENGNPVTPSIAGIETPEGALPGSESVAADCEITLSSDGCGITGEGASAEGGEITLTKPGRYRLQGSLPSGRITVNVSDKEEVLLILDGVSVTNPSGSALRVLSAPKRVTVYLPEGSVNLFAGSKNEACEDGAALDSKEDLVFDGSGSLYVTATGFKGIVSKDDLTVKGGSLSVTADDDGIRGKDSVTVEDGSIRVKAGGDGIRSKNDEDASLGNILIGGGSISIDARAGRDPSGRFAHGKRG